MRSDDTMSNSSWGIISYNTIFGTQLLKHETEGKYLTFYIINRSGTERKYLLVYYINIEFKIF